MCILLKINQVIANKADAPMNKCLFFKIKM
jgi:hypothetical protein